MIPICKQNKTKSKRQMTLNKIDGVNKGFYTKTNQLTPFYASYNPLTLVCQIKSKNKTQFNTNMKTSFQSKTTHKKKCQMTLNNNFNYVNTGL